MTRKGLDKRFNTRGIEGRWTNNSTFYDKDAILYVYEVVNEYIVKPKQAFLVEIGNVQNKNKKKELENYCNRMRGKTEWRYYFIHEKYGEELSKQVFEIIDKPKPENFLEMLEEEIKLRVVINQLNH